MFESGPLDDPWAIDYAPKPDDEGDEEEAADQD